MNLASALQNLNEMFTIKRTVTLETINMTLELKTLTALDEVKVLESCKDFEGSQYVQMLKRNSLAYSIQGVNGVPLDDEIQVSENEKLSKFMFLCGYLDTWPSAIRDLLFEVFTDMNVEVENKVKESMKFERYSVDNPSFEEVKPMFRRVDEPEPEDEADKLKKQVDEEISAEDSKLSQAGG